ncbi:MAG: hypothetical protein JXR96_09590 [Deltaproteobacteria bacterium]|nr:hypothetical protein [Deltaproteobacteria bacterium]
MNELPMHLHRLSPGELGFRRSVLMLTSKLNAGEMIDRLRCDEDLLLDVDAALEGDPTCQRPVLDIGDLLLRAPEGLDSC